MKEFARETFLKGVAASYSKDVAEIFRVVLKRLESGGTVSIVCMDESLEWVVVETETCFRLDTRETRKEAVKLCETMGWRFKVCP